MTIMQIILQPKAIRQIKKIKSGSVRQDIMSAITALANWPEVANSKKLVNLPGYRLRVGAFRIIFAVDEKTIYVMEVKKRDERTY